MNYTHYIIDCLLQGKLVEISGIGTLSLHTVPAKFNKESLSFLPASSTAFFTTEQTGNTDIVQYIAEKEFVSLETAQKFWENYCNALKDKLTADNNCNIEELGTFYTEEGNLFFESTANLSDDNFGFSVLENVKTFENYNLSEEPITTPVDVIPEEPVIEQEITNTNTEDTAPLEVEEPVNVDISEPENETIGKSAEIEEPIAQEEFIEEKVEEIIEPEALTIIENTEIVESEEPVNNVPESIEIIPEPVEEQIVDLCSADEDREEVKGEEVKESHEIIEMANRIFSEEESTPPPLPIAEQNLANEVIVEKAKIVEPPILLGAKNKPKKKRKFFVFLRILIVLIILLLLFLWLFHYCDFNKLTNNTIEHKVTTTQADNTQNIHPAVKQADTILITDRAIKDTLLKDTVSKITSAKTTAKPQKHSPSSSIPKISPVSNVDESGVEILPKSKQGIDIMIGFFLVKENALKECKRMQAMGYSAYIVERQPKETKQYYVSLGSFNNKNNAIDFMQKAYQEKHLNVVLRDWK